MAQPGCWRACCQAGLGGGGGAPDAGSGPSLREFPHGGADACTPRQGLTLLYGPSICTRSVQMDLCRNQVRRLFPTPGSGTLWVSGESLRDRHVSCLPRWTVCPTRSPSQDTNRSTCRGECSWSGPLATPPGWCHLGPLANGPGRNPPYCLRSGGADTDTGGAPKPQRSGTSPASFAALVTPAPPRSLRCLSLPSRFRPQGHPPVPRPLPCPLAPAMPRLPLLSAPALACWCPLLPVFFFSCPPPPCPLAVSSLSPPFSWVGGRVVGGGGASSLSALLRKHVVSTAQARGAALVPPLGGGVRRVTPAATLPVLRLHPWWSPRWGLHGACSLWAWSCVSSRTLAPLPPHPAAAPSGGGSASCYRRPPCPLDFPSLPSLLSLVGVGARGGVGGAPSWPFLRRKHVAGTVLARGTALVLLLGSGARRVAPVFALPTLRSLPRCPPRRGLHGACFPWARSCGPSRTLSPPSPLLAALSSGGGAAVRPSLPASPTLEGAEARGGGGGLVIFPSSLPCHRHEVRHPSAGGGGGVRLVAPVVALSTLRPPSRWSPRRGLHGACPLRARSCGSSRHRCPPALPRCPRGGGRLSPPPYPLSPPSGGRGWVGGGGAPFSSPLRCTHVAGKT